VVRTQPGGVKVEASVIWLTTAASMRNTSSSGAPRPGRHLVAMTSVDTIYTLLT
jgi:hypothetical protein